MGKPGPGGAAAVVSAPADACPRITLSPSQGPVGATVHVSGTGFAPSSPLVLVFEDIPIAFSAAASDAAGNVTGTFIVPHEPAGNLDYQQIYNVYLYDAAANVAVASFVLCSNTPADGIFTGGDPIFFTGPTGPPFANVEVLAYIHHAGAHWIAWQDTSQFGSNLTTFPPPANHALNLTRIGDDGSTSTYEIDTDYAWGFASGDQAFSGTRDTKNLYFESWSKPIYDIKLASDGTTLWVAVLTAESVIYPWISTDDGDATHPSQISQFVDLPTLTSNFTSFATSADTGYLRYFHDVDGFLGFYDAQFPTSDGGDHGFGYWNPPRIVMFAGGVGGFSRIGTVDAKYCPGVTDGTTNAHNASFGNPFLAQIAPLGSWNSPLAIAASSAEPGVCHLVWSEGGDWGPCGRGSGSTPDVWDAGPPNRSYRVVYSTWDSAGKTGEHNLWDATVDRTNWYFEYATQDQNGAWNLFKVGYSWPEQEEMMATGQFQLRNEHGSPVLFIAWPQVLKNPAVDSLVSVFPPTAPDNADRPWLDNAQWFTLPTVEMYDISGGTATLLQQITSDLLPTETESEFYYPLDPSRGLVAPVSPDVLGGGLLGYNSGAGTFEGSQARTFGVSFLYQDPLLNGASVYLLSVPWWRSAVPLGRYPMRGFYRVPVDGSAPFDFLDGTRQLEFTIVGTQGNSRPTFGNFDFYSDAKNIWCPNGYFEHSTLATSTPGVQYDRICTNTWTGYLLQPSDVLNYVPGGWSPFGAPGFYHDPVADTISYPAQVTTGELYAIAQLQVCRGCRTCQCQPSGVHAFLRFGHNR